MQGRAGWPVCSGRHLGTTAAPAALPNKAPSQVPEHRRYSSNNIRFPPNGALRAWMAAGSRLPTGHPAQEQLHAVLPGSGVHQEERDSCRSGCWEADGSVMMI